MAIKTPQDMFLHGLASAYYSEHTTLKGMQEMLHHAQTDRVKKMLEHHLRETQTQVSKLEQCFTELGAKPHEAKCYVADGLLEDFKALAKEVQDKQLIDFAILGVMDKTEHFETATYRGLALKAKLMGLTRIAEILGDIESGEGKESRKVEAAEEELGRKLFGTTHGGPTLRS